MLSASRACDQLISSPDPTECSNRTQGEGSALCRGLTGGLGPLGGGCVSAS